MAQAGDQEEEKSSPRTFLICAKSHGSLQSVGTWTAKGGYANWCHDLLRSPLLAAASDERRLEWFRGLKWCAIDAACRAGDGNHARRARASKPGPTWTHQRFGLIAWDKHTYLREPTDLVMPSLVWSDLVQGIQGTVSFVSSRSRADETGVYPIHSHSRQSKAR
ncbi:hypothetical protein V8C34DRAFT_292849 [Trichoderma compactum]